MSRYQKRFAELADKGEGAFVTFLVIGDPSPEQSLHLMKTVVQSGSDMLELGFPFSDPLADGPTIQRAMDRALSGGMNPSQCFEIIQQFREGDSETPIGLLVYANLVCAFGMERFYETCGRQQIDSVLVADAPLAECSRFCEMAMAHGVDPVLLCPPNIAPPHVEQLARLGRGYTYLLSRAGVTGAAVAAGRPVDPILAQLRQSQAPPPLLGFGISRPEHVTTALAAGAAGVICGSAVIDRISRNLDSPGQMHAELSEFVSSMKSATRISSGQTFI